MWRILAGAFLLVGFLAAVPVAAEEPPPTDTVSLNLPENLEVGVLADLVSQQLGLNIVYDEQVRGKQVTVRAPTGVPKESLLPLLESSLRMKGLVLVDGDQPGWKRIVNSQSLVALAGPASVEEGATAAAVTRVFQLRHAAAKRVEEVLRSFISQPGGNSLTIEERGLLGDGVDAGLLGEQFPHLQGQPLVPRHLFQRQGDGLGRYPDLVL